MLRRVKSLSIALPVFLGLAAASTAAGQDCQTPPFSQYHMGWMPGRTVFYATSGFSGEEISCLEQAIAKWGSAVVFKPTNDWEAAKLKVYKTTLPPGIGGNTSGVDGSDTYLDHATIQITNNRDLVSSCDGFLKVMIHEVGHTMGLGDLNGCCGSSVMNQMLNANDSGGNIPTQVTTCDQNRYWDGTYRQPPNPEEQCLRENGFWDGIRCIPYEEWHTPLIVDLLGNGFHLTGPESGVLFDLDADGNAERLAWTEADSDEALLALDRNGNGLIDNGTELFGDSTAQPSSATPNGFAALAVFDVNADGWIDERDSVYEQLRLWRDSNHDGVSQPDELRTLDDAGLCSISLDVKQSQRRDGYGNYYRYRAKLVTSGPRVAGPYIYDVFLAGRRK